MIGNLILGSPGQATLNIIAIKLTLSHPVVPDMVIGREIPVEVIAPLNGIWIHL